MAEHKIIFSEDGCMKHLEDESAQLVIAFLPNIEGKSPEKYFYDTEKIIKESVRALSQGCKICIGIEERPFLNEGRYKAVSVKSEIISLLSGLCCDYMGSIIRQTSPAGGGTVLGSYPYPRNGILKINYDYILIFKKYGNAPKPTEEQKSSSIMTSEEWQAYFSPIWRLESENRREESIKRLIKMFSFADETVLDPFMYDGATALCAKKLGRRSVSYERDKTKLNEIRRRLNADQLTLWGEEFEFIYD